MSERLVLVPREWVDVMSLLCGGWFSARHRSLFGAGLEGFGMLAMREPDFVSGSVCADFAVDEMGGASFAEVTEVRDVVGGRVVFAVLAHVFMHLVHGLEVG